MGEGFDVWIENVGRIQVIDDSMLVSRIPSDSSNYTLCLKAVVSSLPPIVGCSIVQSWQAATIP